MSIQTDLTRITNAKSAIKAAIEGKGVTVPDATLLDGMAALIESIEAGGGLDLSELGITKSVSGSFTMVNDNSSTETIYHRMGIPPKLVIVYTPTATVEMVGSNTFLGTITYQNGDFNAETVQMISFAWAYTSYLRDYFCAKLNDMAYHSGVDIYSGEYNSSCPIYEVNDMYFRVNPKMTKSAGGNKFAAGVVYKWVVAG